MFPCSSLQRDRNVLICLAWEANAYKRIRQLFVNGLEASASRRGKKKVYNRIMLPPDQMFIIWS